MKIRTDFVTNSSSSSFVFWGFYSKKLLEYVLELVEKNCIYPYDNFYPNKSNDFLVSCKQKKGLAVIDDLRFFPYYGTSEKSGFQISETTFKHNNPLDALLSFINLSNLPADEAKNAKRKLEQLVTEAQEKHQILNKRKMGMTDNYNHVFDENSIIEVLYEFEGKTLTSCRDKNAESVSIKGWGLDFSRIGPSVFENNTNLESVDVDRHISSVCEKTFAGCTNLKRIKIGYGSVNQEFLNKYPNCSYLDVSNIEKEAFKNCEGLESIWIKGNCNIKTRAFENCSSLESIVFYDVKKIGSFAFAGCKNLKDVYFQEEYGDPKYDLQLISPSAFKGCDNVVFHGFENTYAHRYAEKNNIKNEMKPIIVEPKDYSVKKMLVNRTRNAEGLTPGDKVIIKYTGGYGDGLRPDEVTVYTDEGNELGFIYVDDRRIRKIIKEHPNEIKATVVSFKSMYELKKEKPNAKESAMTINLEFPDLSLLNRE